MHIYLEQCSECGGWHTPVAYEAVSGTAGSSTNVCSCVPDEKHDELLEESLEKHKDIWERLAKGAYGTMSKI